MVDRCGLDYRLTFVRDCFATRECEHVKIRFLNFEFDQSTGELTQSTDGKATVSRLPPQPSQLLELLLNNYPEITSHQAIGDELWPGTGVDYEANLHFCIRQIRSALNDSASKPKFVETIPRRGYRWIAEFKYTDAVQPASTDGVSSDPDVFSQDRDDSAVDYATPKVTKAFDDKVNDSEEVLPDSFVEPVIKNGVEIDSSIFNTQATNVLLKRLFLFASLFVIAIVCISFLIHSMFKTTPTLLRETTENPLIAIMPFKTTKPEFKSIGTGEIGWGILEQLEFAKFNVVGPTTTSRFDEPPQLMWDLVDEFKIDLIVNGKFFLDEGNPVILAEIIRAADGAHIWVDKFATSSSQDEITRSIVDAINSISSE